MTWQLILRNQMYRLPVTTDDHTRPAKAHRNIHLAIPTLDTVVVHPCTLALSLLSFHRCHQSQISPIAYHAVLEELLRSAPSHAGYASC